MATAIDTLANTRLAAHGGASDLESLQLLVSGLANGCVYGLIALGFVLISAYREELYFRAYLLTVLEEIATPPWLAVLTSALLFGLGHLYQGWLAAVTAVLIGVGFALLYRHRPSVHRLAWAHAAFNLAVLTGTLFAG